MLILRNRTRPPHSQIHWLLLPAQHQPTQRPRHRPLSLRHLLLRSPPRLPNRCANESPAISIPMKPTAFKCISRPHGSLSKAPVTSCLAQSPPSAPPTKLPIF